MEEERPRECRLELDRPPEKVVVLPVNDPERVRGDAALEPSDSDHERDRRDDSEHNQKPPG
jgi:hypothetical protein